MKKSIFVLSMCVSLVAFAQEEDKTTQNESKPKDNSEVKTLFSKKDGSKTLVSGWGGFTSSYQQLNGKHAYSSSLRGGVLLNHALTLGLGGGWTVTGSEINDALSSTLSFGTTSGYGGFIIGYDVKPLEPIHFTSSILIGAGGVYYYNGNHSYYYYDDNNGSANTPESDYYYNSKSGDATYVIRPSIGLDLNIAEWFRLGIEAAYLYAPNSAVYMSKYKATADTAPVEVIKENGMSGFSAGLSFKFGVF